MFNATMTILHYKHYEIPSEIASDPRVRYWDATDPQLELWATKENSYFIQFTDPAQALVFIFKHPDMVTVIEPGEAYEH